MTIPLTIGPTRARPTMPSANSPYLYGSGLPQWRPPRPTGPQPQVLSRATNLLPEGAMNPYDINRYGLAPGTTFAQAFGLDPTPGYNDSLPPAITPPPITAPPAGASGAGATPGGGNFDWSSMIGGSWEVAQAEAMMAQQMSQARQTFETDLRSAFVNLGYTGGTSSLGNLSQYIDSGTIQNAIANKFSTYAQIANQERRTGATNNAALAARGILNSGQTTKSATDTIQAAEQARYSALQEFLTGARGGLTHLGELQSQQAMALMQARFAAAQRLAQQYGLGMGNPLGAGGPTMAGMTGGLWDPLKAPYGVTQEGNPITFGPQPGDPDWLNWISGY